MSAMGRKPTLEDGYQHSHKDGDQRYGECESNEERDRAPIPLNLVIDPFEPGPRKKVERLHDLIVGAPLMSAMGGKQT